MNLFSTFDIQSGYNNILVKPEDRHRAAFKMVEGQFKPIIMPFGLMNVPRTFQRMINHYTRPLQIKYRIRQFKVYLNNVLIAIGKEDPPEMHDQIIHKWLEICHKYQLFVQIDKCRFKQQQVEYLGLLINGDKIRLDPTKLKGIMEWPEVLISKGEVRSTLGVLGYQRIFIKNFSKLAAPLTRLTKKEASFIWMEECTAAIQNLKKALTRKLVLWQPIMNKPFFLEVDASDYATGAILFQKNHEGRPRICSVMIFPPPHFSFFFRLPPRYIIPIISPSAYLCLLTSSPLPLPSLGQLYLDP
jgi:hypothetical protein